MNLCLITGIFPPDIGGPSTYISHLASFFHQQNTAVCVITLGDAIGTYPFPVKRVSRTAPLPIRLLRLFVTLIRYGWRSDVWYINGLELPAVLAGKLLRKRMVMKIVGDYAWERAMNAGLTPDSIDDFQQRKQRGNVEFHKKLRAWYTRQIHAVITPSQYLKTLVCGWGVPAARVHVIYNAVEGLSADLGTQLEARRRLGLAVHDQFIITVARLVSWKGIDRLIRTLLHLDESIKLLIVGDGPEKNKLTELADTLSLTQRVEFIGKTDRTLVLAYIRASDVFVLNTGYEGFSHVLLEAMMVGTPVITTSVCGNPELVTHQENGILVAPCDRTQDCQGNVEELRASIMTLLQDASLREKVIEGGKQTVKHYSWDRLLQQTVNVLCDC